MVYTELYHHGIKGQRWGIRRYQNPDGSLTSAGQKRYSKEYDTNLTKAASNVTKNASSRYVKAWNKAADDVNNDLIDKYNKKHDPKDSDYEEKYESMFEELMVHYYNKMLLDEIRNDSNYKKAKDIYSKYKDLKISEAGLSANREFDETEKSVNSFNRKEFEKKYGLD